MFISRYLRTVRTFLGIYAQYRWLDIKSFFIPHSRISNMVKLLNSANAEIIRELAFTQKGILIKVGQFLSTRVDVLPREVTGPLSLLQDSVPPAPFEYIQKVIESELKQPLEDIFLDFSREPIAAASLGQVHVAHLRTGEKVAVKVQYPDIREIIETDLAAIKFGMRLAERHNPFIDFEAILSEFRSILNEEIDYVHEGKNAELFAELFSDEPDLVVPKIHWNYTTKQVLTTHFIEGFKIDQIDAIREAGFDTKIVAQLLARIYCRQIYEKGIFHADPHPGNIMVLPGNRICFIDFGVMKKIPDWVRKGIVIVHEGVIIRDNERILEGLIKCRILAHDGDLRPARRIIETMQREFRDMPSFAHRDLDFKWLTDKVREFIQNTPHLRYPSDLILLSRTFGILEGLIALYDPTTNIIEAIAPFAKDYFLQDPMPLISSAATKSAQFGGSLINLPIKLEEILRKTLREDLLVRAEVSGFSDAVNSIYRLGQQMILTVLILSTGMFGVILFIKGETQIAGYFLIGYLTFLMMFIISIIRR